MTVMTFQASGDAYIDGKHPETNYGSEVSGVHSIAYVNEKSHWIRTWGEFDVSVLAGLTIVSASLYRKIIAVNLPDLAARLARCERPGTVVESEITWYEWASGEDWDDNGGDYDDTTPPVKTYTEPSSTGWHELTGLKAFVDDALENRNGIFAFISRFSDEDPEVSSQVTWRSRDYETEADRQYLEVNYTRKPSSQFIGI